MTLPADVSQVTSSFTVKATCFGLLGCDTIEGFMNVYVPYITISMPSPLGVLSDTPHLFIMEPISVGGRGNLIEWSADSAFTASYTDTSPTSISAIVNPGADTLIWLRAIDSVTGCVSKAATIQMIVMSTDTLPDPVYDTIITQCVGTSVEIPIANTHGGYLYSLRIDTTVVASSLGNDDVLILNTGAIDTMTLFNIIAADTTKTTYEILDSAILVMVLEPVDTPIFYEGDTFVYALDSLVYIAVAENAVFTNYSILSGDATIDTLTGVVFHPNSDFVVRATATGLTGCGTTTADLQVTVTNIASPIAPESQYVVADSFEAKTVTLSAVQAGEGGDEIEWAVNLDFDNSTIVSSPADIGLMLEAGSDSLIWLRSRNSTTGKVSRSLRRQRKNEYKVMSAGILDKTHWEYNAERSDEFTYGDLAELRNSDKWFFGICFDAGSALPVDCDIENCATHWVLAKNESTGNWYQQSEDYINNYTTETGDGGEVDILDPGIAAFTATKLALPKTSPYNATTCAYPFEAPLSFHYQSGGVVAKNFVVNLSETSLMELRCITPAGTGAWPSFWTFGGSFEFDMFENYNGASKTTSNVHDNDRPEGQRGCQYSTWKKTDCDYSQDWHTYSILINTEEIIFFVDGKETRSIDRTVNPYPQNMTNGNKGILTFGLGIQQGADDESYQMLVDYFRYYTPKANTGSECNIPKRSLQNLDVCTAKTLENTRYSSTLSHHYPAPVVNSFIHVTRDITGANLGVISSGSNTKVFFNSYTLCGIATQYSNGLWTESAILPVEFFKVWLPFHGKVNIPLPRFPDVKNYITPVTEKLVYYQSLGNRLQYYSYNSFWGLWEKRIPLIAGKKNRPIPANCAGYLNTDFAGRIWYKGTDKKIWCWNPLLKEHTSLNHTSLVEGSMVMHTCGCLTYYCDNQHNLRQMQWHNGTWTSSANPVVDIWEIPLHGTIPQHVNILGDLLIDEAEGRSRVYFIGSNHAVYYYSWITQETVKLKFSSVQDANNNETRCELYHNAASQLTLSPDGNMIYYRGTDDKIWYYFSDREDSKILIDNDELLLVARENWNKTPMDYSSSIMGPMAFKPGPFGDLYYAGQRNKLHVVKWVSADIPAPCPESDGWQIASYKTDNSNGTDMPEVKDSHDSSRAALDTSNVISVKVYPNPSHDVFFIEIAGVESGSFIDIQIETPAGKAVFESRQRIAAGSKYHHLRWDADNVPLGLYLYKIYSGKGQVSYGKIIKM
ncbi:MAG: family 16 glycosylhydrolase [Bacteroidetes bacterium]|nr:family 16 glycosylhydrolase [Bacteroidota bacterium]